MTKTFEYVPGKALAYDPSNVMDADWIPNDDMDLVQVHFNRLDKLHHADDATPAELAWRIRNARRSIRRNCRRVRAEGQRLTAFVQRLLAGSVLFFLWVVIIALLVG